MTIKHQTVFDSDGKPTAALIPWEEFETLRDRLATLDDEQLSPGEFYMVEQGWLRLR